MISRRQRYGSISQQDGPLGDLAQEAPVLFLSSACLWCHVCGHTPATWTQQGPQPPPACPGAATEGEIHSPGLQGGPPLLV